jgi:site-specific DNA-methyltransferase (adenine-specific)
MGSGSALVAAARLGRRYVGYDLDETYVAIARRRVAEIADDDGPPVEDTQRHRRIREGKAAQKLAEDVLREAGFVITGRDHRIPRTGVTVDFVATDADGAAWVFDVPGTFTSHRGGLLRTDTVWKALGRAHAVRNRIPGGAPLVLLTTHLPRRPSEGDTALRSAGPDAFFDAVELLSEEARLRLERYARGGYTNDPQVGFWTAADLTRRT